jgi:hypothetical protein
VGEKLQREATPGGRRLIVDAGWTMTKTTIVKEVGNFCDQGEKASL